MKYKRNYSNSREKEQRKKGLMNQTTENKTLM